MNEVKFIGWHGIIVLVLYAVFIMGTCIYLSARQTRKDNLKSFYLGGGGLGTLLLFFTLYATQYSGNTVVGYAPKAYRAGYSYFQSIPFFIMVIVGYLLFAPRLHVLAKKHSFVTPADWLQKRFDSKAVTLLGTLLMAYGLSNYLLEQLVAMGHAISGLTAGVIPYFYGIIFLVIIMFIYEWMGGMKAVAIADTINGIALMIGVISLMFLSLKYFGNLGETARYIAETVPAKIGVPPMSTSINWISIYILVGVGAAVYPHAIQRIYAAKSERVLKKSLSRMAWMPFITSGMVFIIGILGIKAFPGLEKAESEKLIGMVANVIASRSALNYWMMMILYTGIIGAIMSTTDSVILALSSLISNDIYGRFVKPDAKEKDKVLWGKVVGICIVLVLLIIAWKPPATLYEIFVLKFEILIQVAPAFLLGLYWKKLNKTGVLLGMIAGAIVASGMTFAGVKTLYGIHGGVIGLAVNMAICILISLAVPSSKAEEEKAEKVISLNA